MKYFKNIIVLFVFFLLSNCSHMTLSLMDMLNYSKTGADIISYANTQKTTSDHLISYVFSKDCSLARTLKLQAICNEIQKENHRSFSSLNKERIKIIKYKHLKSIKNNYSKKKQPVVPSMAY